MCAVCTVCTVMCYVLCTVCTVCTVCMYIISQFVPITPILFPVIHKQVIVAAPEIFPLSFGLALVSMATGDSDTPDNFSWSCVGLLCQLSELLVATRSSRKYVQYVCTYVLLLCLYCINSYQTGINHCGPISLKWENSCTYAKLFS